MNQQAINENGARLGEVSAYLPNSNIAIDTSKYNGSTSTLQAISPRFSNPLDGDPADIIATLKEEQSRNLQLLKKDEFPTDALPPQIQKIVTELTKEFPLAYVAPSILLASAVAIGNSYKLLIKEPYEPLKAIMYLCEIGNPNVKKSQSLNWPFKPFEYLDNKAEDNDEDAIDDEVSRTKNVRQFIVHNHTIEALRNVSKGNKRGFCVHQNELSGWWRNFGRHNNGDDSQFWLHNWDGFTASTNTLSGGAMRVRDPFICVAGTTQPRYLKDLASNYRDSNGFIDRFLFSFPEGLKKPKSNKNSVDRSITEQWYNIIYDLLNLDLSTFELMPYEPVICKFTPHADKIYTDWFDNNADMCNDPDNAELAELYGKYDLHVPKLALIIQRLYDVTCNNGNNDGYVDTDAINSGIMIGEWFRKQAKRVYNFRTGNDPLSFLSPEQRLIVVSLPEKQDRTYQRKEIVEVARRLNYSEHTADRLLKNGSLFSETKNYGKYKLVNL